MAEIQDVMDRIVAIQQAITPPAGEASLKVCYDEPPTQVVAFPCFVNEEELTEQSQFASAHRHIVFDVAMHLLFAPADQKYSVRARRRWIKPVLDAFGGDIQLGGTASRSQITAIDYAPYALNETEYVAATFTLNVDMSDTFQAVA